MPHDHRMRPLWGNTNPTPRLEALLMRKSEENRSPAQSSPFLDYVLANRGAQNALNNYRMVRDEARGNVPRSAYYEGMATMARYRLEGKPPYGPATEEKPLPDIAKTVGKVFKERHK